MRQLRTRSRAVSTWPPWMDFINFLYRLTILSRATGMSPSLISSSATVYRFNFGSCWCSCHIYLTAVRALYILPSSGRGFSSNGLGRSARGDVNCNRLGTTSMSVLDMLVLSARFLVAPALVDFEIKLVICRRGYLPLLQAVDIPSSCDVSRQPPCQSCKPLW